MPAGFPRITSYNVCYTKLLRAVDGQFYANQNAWVELRFAEVVLDYAEACIELGGNDLQNGINALNMVRNRAGLPDRVTTDQAQARTWLQSYNFV